MQLVCYLSARHLRAITSLRLLGVDVISVHRSKSAGASSPSTIVGVGVT
jgi:hypothetical protein